MNPNYTLFGQIPLVVDPTLPEGCIALTDRPSNRIVVFKVDDVTEEPRRVTDNVVRVLDWQAELDARRRG